MFERFTPEARKSISLANREAHRWGRGSIEPAHLLAGLLSVEGSGACRVLETLEIDLRIVCLRIEMQGLLDSTDLPGERVILPWTPESKCAIEASGEEALNLGDEVVCSEHLLLGVLRSPDRITSTILDQLGVSVDRVRQLVSDVPRSQ